MAPRYPRGVYESLLIENFRGLHHLELSSLAPVTILTGRNNVGKTAVLEALFLHASGPRAALNYLTALRPFRFGSPVVNIELSSQSSPWESAFYNRDVNSTIRLSARLDRKLITVELSTPHQSSSQQISRTLPTEIIDSALTSEAAPEFSSAMRIMVEQELNGSKQKSPFTQTVSAQIGPVFASPQGVQRASGVSFELKPDNNSGPLVFAHFLNMQNRSPQAQLAQRYSNLRLRGLDKSFSDALRAIEPTLEAIEILAAGNPTLYFTLRGGPPLPIALMGEGMTAVANYAAAIFESSGGLVLIDEFENGIHYSALEKVWTQIRRAVKDTGTQVVASTHSYECVQAAYRAFGSDRDALKLIRLKRGEDSPAAIAALEYDPESLEGALDMDLDLR
jgi:hypothetical protein